MATWMKSPEMDAYTALEIPGVIWIDTPYSSGFRDMKCCAKSKDADFESIQT